MAELEGLEGGLLYLEAEDLGLNEGERFSVNFDESFASLFV